MANAMHDERIMDTIYAQVRDEAWEDRTEPKEGERGKTLVDAARVIDHTSSK